ncbi:response regulator [Ancrocorticia populi]|uniref:response regulator n=1 Tax=Ancrocorticia populi TaxID=2175228 RepID=UPI0023542A53|nr:response regulator [Ancrocorticia populi]MDN6486491.1 response regulator [Ancrocorticia sp.]
MTLCILILEDEPEVRHALERDLQPFADRFQLESAESYADAWDVVEEIVQSEDELALVLSDHRLPDRDGVDFLISLSEDDRVSDAKKILVTGQAYLDDTVRAVNKAHLDYYVAKPWEAAELCEVVRELLTDYVLENGVDPLHYMRDLDEERILEVWR